MRPRGQGVDECGGGSGSSSDEEAADDGVSGGGGGEEEWVVEEEGSVVRALTALDGLRRARQHYDVVLCGADGGEVPAHRALLAAHSPHLLQLLPPTSAAPILCRVPHAQTAALSSLVAWCYMGRLVARGAATPRALYLAAWALRMEGARALVADRLVRRVSVGGALAVRALPDLAAKHRAQLTPLIQAHFDELCSSGALSTLPLLRVDLVTSSSSTGGLEAPAAVAQAVLQWLQARHATTAVSLLTARDHLVYVDPTGELRDCDQLPTKQAGGPVIAEYRLQAAAARRDVSPSEDDESAPGELVLRGRAPRAEWEVVAAKGAGGVTRAVLLVHGSLVACRLSWRDVGNEVVVGGPLGGALEAAQGGERRAPLQGGRAGAPAAQLGGRLLLLGGYDRAMVLKEVMSYDPSANQWSPLAAMRVPRARCPAACLGGTLYVIGGSDGHHELDSVHAYTQESSLPGGGGGGGGSWRVVHPLPAPLCLAGGCAAGGGVWAVGGEAGGRPLKASRRYCPLSDAWTDGPTLNTARSQMALVPWQGALWALGGCDAWHCLTSTETLALDAEGVAVGGWSLGPALPTARRSVGGAAWLGALYCAGGSDGLTSLTRVDRMRAPAGPWEGGPALRRGRAGAALVALGDVLYIVGGFDGKEFLSCVECLYSEDGEWTSLCNPPPPSRAVGTPPAGAAGRSCGDNAEGGKAATHEPGHDKESMTVVNGDGAH